MIFTGHRSIDFHGRVRLTSAPESMMDEWRRHLAAQVSSRAMAQSTRISYIRGMGRFDAWSSAKGRAWNNPETVVLWRESLVLEGYRAGSINTWLAGVKSFFSWATASGWIPKSPAKELSGVSREERDQSRIPLTQGELRRLLAQPDDSSSGRRDHAMLCMMAFMALRAIEIQRASIGDLYVAHRDHWRLEIAQPAATLPKSSVEVAPLHARDALADWLLIHPRAGDSEAPLFVSLGNRSQGERLTLRAIRRIIKEHLVSAGVQHPQKSTQSLRSTAINNALQSGASLEHVRALSRHRSLMGFMNQLQRLGTATEQDA